MRHRATLDLSRFHRTFSIHAPENRYSKRISHLPKASETRLKLLPIAWSPVVYILGLLCAPALSNSGSSFSAFAYLPMTYLSVSLLLGHSLCATMELGSPESSYLELLNSDADPLRLYHLYEQTDLAGEEEIELSSGGSCSLGPLLAFSGRLHLRVLDSKLEKSTTARQNHGQLRPLLGALTLCGRRPRSLPTSSPPRRWASAYGLSLCRARHGHH